METFVYSCPSCGAKVDYNENTRLWECSYCENVYEAIFDDDDSKLPKIEDKNYLIYRYNCDKCNTSFFSVLEKDGLCNSCGTIVRKNGEPINVHNVLKLDVTRGTAAHNYNQTLENLSENIRSDYSSKEFKLSYYEFDSYQGVIKFSYENNSKKYIFADLFVPNIDNEDYRFFYEVSKTKVKESDCLYNKDVDLIPLTKNPYNSRKLKNIDKKIIDENTIVEICRNHFIKTNHILDVDKIKEEKSFNYNEGNFVPVYVYEQNVNNVIYREYQFGNSNFNNNEKLITEFDNISIDREIFTYKLRNIIWGICGVLMFLVALILAYSYMPVDLLFLNTIIAFVFSYAFIYEIVVKKIKKNNKKIRKLDSSRLMTREEYFENLINNNGQIKVIDNRNKR